MIDNQVNALDPACDHEWGLESTLDIFPAFHVRQCAKCGGYQSWTGNVEPHVWLTAGRGMG